MLSNARNNVILEGLQKSRVSEAMKYQKGKRYKTDDGMYFVVKKINKDGTIKVYDEDVNKEYDCEVSDLELLHPELVKEGAEVVESAKFVSGKAFKPSKTDMEKMYGYYEKSSNPDALARTVKDIDKAQSRYFIALAMGWEDTAKAFRSRCIELGATKELVDEIAVQASKFDIPDEYKVRQARVQAVKDVLGTDAKSESILKNNFSKLFKVIIANKLPYKVEASRDILSDIDSRNGRAWTLAYKLTVVMPNGDKMDMTINNHTSESVNGGSYGVSYRCPADHTFVGYETTQENMAKDFEKLVEKHS